MNDLVEFLRARLDEDEQAARATGHLVKGAVFVLDDDYKHETLVMPAGRMLREVEAKRRILDEHPHGPPTADGAADDVLFGCRTCGVGVDGWMCIDGWCTTLRLLALPYADHPDFKPEWRA